MEALSTISAMESITAAKTLAEKVADMNSSNSALSEKVSIEESKVNLICTEESYIDSNIQILESTLKIVKKSHDNSTDLFENSMDTVPLLARLKHFSEIAQPNELTQQQRADKLRTEQTKVIDKYEASAIFKNIVEIESETKELDDLLEAKFLEREALDKELDSLDSQLIDMRNI